MGDGQAKAGALRAAGDHGHEYGVFQFPGHAGTVIDNVYLANQAVQFGANGELAATGLAEEAGEGYYTVTLSADVTSKLEAGSNKLEVVVISKLVSIPTFAPFEFVTAP